MALRSTASYFFKNTEKRYPYVTTAAAQQQLSSSLAAAQQQQQQQHSRSSSGGVLFLCVGTGFWSQLLMRDELGSETDIDRLLVFRTVYNNFLLIGNNEFWSFHKSL